MRAKNKRLRNSGQPYQSKDKHGNLQNRFGALPIGPDCTCRDLCSKKIGRVGIQKVYDDFWALADYDLQNSDLIKKIKRKATRNQVDKGQFNPCRVKAVSSYWVSYQEMHYKVCLTAFTSMHGIRKGRVERVNKKRTETDSVVPDQRSRSGNHNRISEECKKVVYEAIENLSSRCSHYTLERNPNKRYIDLPDKKPMDFFL